MKRFVTASLLALSVSAVSASAAPVTLNHNAVATAFDKLCLKAFPQDGRTAKAAARMGLTKVSDAQWSQKAYGITALSFAPGSKHVRAEIDLNALGIKDGYDKFAFGMRVGKSDGACAVLASTSPENLYKSIALAVAKYGAVKVKPRARGNAATIVFSINGANAQIEVKPMRIQGHRDFSAILIEQK